MSRYKMDDGTVVNTEKTINSWHEDERWDGSNWISKATGSQWHHERLHKSQKGRYYLESWSNWQDATEHAEWVDKHTAAAWLIANGHVVPEDIREAANEVEE